MGKSAKEGKSPERVEMEKQTPYPYYVFYILGNEFCERYAYYGMRSILIIFLKNFLKMDNDLSTIVYHVFAALCYFFPLIGGIIADSYWGKVKTILYLSIVYLIGMVLMAVAAIPQLGGNADKTEPGLTNEILTYIALLTVAIGTGGIKPCVSSLGGDQFKDNEVGREQLAGFFSLFYASINAGSLLSTFISPLLRDTQCFDRDDCFFIAFIVPAVLMGVAIIAFLVGRSKYIETPPAGNIFVSFCSATWQGIKGKFQNRKSSDKKDHFLDYAVDAGCDAKTAADAKFIYPIIVMFLPLPFFWALFDMQGSRWIITATQMNGWQGGDSFKMRPDQIQILNPIMILLFLPLFSKVIYPLFEKCGIQMTALRRMSAGQVITALAFMVSGFVQNSIDQTLTAVPYYGTDNALMVVNGVYGDTPITVTSDYWLTVDAEKLEDGVSISDSHTLQEDVWRTPTFAWINHDLPVKGTELKVGEDTLKLGEDVEIDEKQIRTVVRYKEGPLTKHFEYNSPQEKSDSIKVKSVIVNPSNYFLVPRLRYWKYSDDEAEDVDFNGNTGGKDKAFIEQLSALQDGLEFEQGIYKIQLELYADGTIDDTGKGTVVGEKLNTCETKWITQKGMVDSEDELKGSTFDDLKFLPGSIWTFILRVDETDPTKCEVLLDQDSNHNEVNIFLLVPQYLVITIGEVMNSATGLEFAYTQAPPSMKSVVQSFWLLTTCLGNIIDIFFVEIQLWNTQTGEYFILAMIMFAAAMIFSALSIFYYDYVPDDAFTVAVEDTAPVDEEKTSENGEKTEVVDNVAYDSDEL